MNTSTIKNNWNKLPLNRYNVLFCEKESLRKNFRCSRYSGENLQSVNVNLASKLYIVVLQWEITDFVTGQEMVGRKNSSRSGKSRGMLFSVREKWHFNEKFSQVRMKWFTVFTDPGIKISLLFQQGHSSLVSLLQSLGQCAKTLLHTLRLLRFKRGELIFVASRFDVIFGKISTRRKIKVLPLCL